MRIELTNIKPAYMLESEVSSSDIFQKKRVIFQTNKKYLIKASSGKGKTSILNFIYGNNIKFNGKISYGKEKGNIFDLRRTKISYVFQDLKLFDNLTVYENLKIKNEITHYKSEEEINSLISKLDLEKKKNNIVANLSLGQKQRVAIIRSLLQPFRFLLLDEPFSHLDSFNTSLACKLIKNEIKKTKASIILTSLKKNENTFVFDKTFNI